MARDERLRETESWSDCICQVCGRPFPQREHYERTCPICYKEGKGYNVLWGDLAFTWVQERLHEARQKLKVLEGKPKPPPDRNLDVPGDLLMDLIFLCHPDKHGGSTKATAATQALLAMRDKKKATKKRRR